MPAPVKDFILKYQTVLSRAKKLHGRPEPLGFTFRPILAPGHFNRLEGCFRDRRSIKTAERTAKQMQAIKESMRSAPDGIRIRTGRTIRTHRCQALASLFRES